MQENNENILMTSGYNFDGYIITQYLGLCSGEAALGTGFLSSLGAGLADFLGQNSSMYADKLNTARDIALGFLVEHAEQLGANAIISVHFEYTSFSSDIMGVTANGTAVKVERAPGYGNVDFEVRSSDSDLPVKPNRIFLSAINSKCYAKLLLDNVPDNNIYAVKGNLSLFTIFEEELKEENIIFSDFVAENNIQKISSAALISFSPDLFRVIKYAAFEVTKYLDRTMINDNFQVETISGEDAPVQKPIDSLVLNEYLSSIGALGTATDIYNYTIEFNSAHDNVIPDELVKYVKTIASNERLYGNLSRDSVHTVLSYFEKKQ